jgi:uncharacterized membrane protein (UPF0136 family)
MKKEIGKWFMDISKYVTTAIIISGFLGDLQHQWLVFLIGGVIAGVCFGVGTYFMNKKSE